MKTVFSYSENFLIYVTNTPYMQLFVYKIWCISN